MKYASFVSTLFVVLVSLAQENLHDFALKRSLKQDGLHFVFTVMELDAKGVRHYHEDKFYYWMKAQTVIATQGASSGQLLHGEFEAFYLNKQLARKGNFSKGLKQGEWNYWREDGTLEKKERWSNGALQGKQIYYNAAGQVQNTEYLHGNRSKNVCPDSTVFQKSRNRKILILKDSLYQTTDVLRYKNGQLHGVIKHYEHGKLSAKECYKAGESIEKKKKQESGTETETAPTLKDRWNALFKRKADSEKEPHVRKEKEGKENNAGKQDTKGEPKPKKEKTPKTEKEE